MKLSLRARVLLLVALFNALAFAVAGPFLYQRLASEDERNAGREIGTLVRATVRPQGDLNVARILQWISWPIVEDAIVVDQNLEVLEDGRLRASGVVLNPVGSSHRPADFDRQAVLSAAKLAMETSRPVDEVLGGRAVPLEGPKGTWGAAWIRTAAHLDLGPVFANLLPWFLFSTLLLTGTTFFALRGLVLGPVEVLAEGARRVRSGDLETRLREPRRQDELADLVRSFNEMTDTLRSFNERLRHEVERATTEAERAQAIAMTQRRLAAMGELAAGIAHEINNPLGGLLNAVEVLKRGELPEAKVRQYTELLERGLERIRTTVGQLLRFTPRESSMVPVDLHDVALDALALVRHRARSEAVALRLFLGTEPAFDPDGEVDLERVREAARRAGLPTVAGARHELGQALLNLLVNALDALAEGAGGGESPRIEVALEGSRGGVLLTVRDNGPGVEADTLAHVADLFFTTKEVGKGTGLGLSMVHNIVVAHGGEVQFDSAPGRGFEARLWLPRHAGGERGRS